jgi:hypothetical protein
VVCWLRGRTAGAWRQRPPRRFPDVAVRPLRFILRRCVYVSSSLGVGVRLNRAWLFRVRQTAEENRATGVRYRPDDLPVFHSQHYSAGHSGASAYCHPILCQNVTARLTIVGGP